MGVKFTSCISEGFGNSVAGMDEAFKYKEVDRMSTAYFHPEGASFVFSLTFPEMNVFRVFLIPKGKDPVDYSYEWPVITGRGMTQHDNFFRESSEKMNNGYENLGSLVEEGWDRVWMMIGPGMEKLTPHILTVKNERGSSAPVLVSEPVDYGILGSSLIEMSQIVNDMGYSEMKLNGVYPDNSVKTAMERIQIMTDNPRMIHSKFRLGEDPTPPEFSGYSKNVFAAVDCQAAGLYTEDDKNIRKILSGFMHPDHKNNIFVI
ncbi:MAG: hypothetical protein JW754_02570 [Candidatus Aenigmarchaeota archaeon]|nr:hypothetical protein [Candidatus Aenigmarchaeota archaeon]